jgi:hypothetical protein
MKEEPIATCQHEFRTMQHSQAVTVDKETGKKENVTLFNLPHPDEFPGGDLWENEKGEHVENPYWRGAINYALYYEFGARRRAGERVFTMLHRPPQAERGPVQMKASTAEKKLVEAWQREGRSAEWIAKRIAMLKED